MADISKTQNHELESTELRTRLEKLATEMTQKFGIKSNWDGDTCHLSGSVLKNGKLMMADKSVTIELNLGFMAKMMKPQIEKEIDSRLFKILKG
jgi:putative polyhydroxyalkanoate system protein